MKRFLMAFCLLFLALAINLDTFSMESDSLVIIDPGHGGIDKGANVGDVLESDINLAISFYLRDILIEKGFSVMLTRDDDYDLSDGASSRKSADIKNRVKMINASNAKMYISVHQNMFSDSFYKGAQVFYNDSLSKNKEIASSVQNSLKYFLNNTTRNEQEGSSIYLVDNVNIEGFLIECGFMSNKEELTLLCDSRYQEKVAHAIFYGVFDYL